MSTFEGVIIEFPYIRIDYSRRVPDQKPPLACFLSHVHSDHLLGLESLKSPFVYCSPATREILLRLEKYPHCMNFAKGILETRQQTYRRLKNLLKTIPLDTPTTIELCPGNELRVTLLDANHCVGAVVFFIQGGGKAILYTGDIRAEVWWVNSLVRNPILIPYTLGSRTRKLDRIYLDTTFATRDDPYREFPSKADGLRELLTNVEQYPKDTVFHFNAWTFGYEDVWIALSAVLGCPIHLDGYRWSLYKALTIDNSMLVAQEAPPLCGFLLGNHWKDGCLTSNPNVRLHSCERGIVCPRIDKDRDVVQIIPIISRLKTGAEMHELGVGGGKGDLDQIYELEVYDAAALGQLMALCAVEIKDPQRSSRVLAMLTSASGSESHSIRLDAGLQKSTSLDAILDDLPLEELVGILATLAVSIRDAEGNPEQTALCPQINNPSLEGRPLPRTITFPFSRHSSYSELCELVRAFRPRDIWPCTVSEVTWTSAVSVRNLFRHLCSADTFTHDELMLAKQQMRNERVTSKRSREDSPASSENTRRTSSLLASSQTAEYHTAPALAPAAGTGHAQIPDSRSGEQRLADRPLPSSSIRSSQPRTNIRSRQPQTASATPVQSHSLACPEASSTAKLPASSTFSHGHAPIPHITHPTAEAIRATNHALSSVHSPRAALSIREWAYRAAAGFDGYSWADFGGLLCVKEDASRDLDLQRQDGHTVAASTVSAFDTPW